MGEPSMEINNAPPPRSKPFGRDKVIKKTTGLYKSKRFHFQLLILFSIAIVCIIFGSLYLYKCPIQRYIPIFLIVQGAFGLFILLIHLLTIVYVLYITKFKYHFIGITAILISFLGLFLFAWFIAGNVWIFSVVKRVQYTDPTNMNSYCHGILYHAAFWLIIIQYIIAVLLCCSLTCIPQSTKSPTNGIIKVRKQIPKIKQMMKTNSSQPPTTDDIITSRF